MTNSREDAALDSGAQGVKSPARRQFFALATAVGGVAFAGAIYKPAHADIVATLGKIFYLDPTVLNFAFAIEELESDFFARATSTRGYTQLSGAESAALSLMGSQDTAHKELLYKFRDAIGAKDAGSFETLNASESRRPRIFTYPELDSREALLKTALDIKENALFTYHGAVGLLGNKSLLLTAVAIAGIEGRHAVMLRDALGLTPIPTPYEGAISATVAGNRFARYGLKGGSPQQS